jgi:hypothetical protein
MSPSIIPFQAEHIIDLMDVDPFLAQQAVMAERNIELGGLGWSAMLDGKCIGCAAVLKESTRYTIWVTTSPELLRHKIWFHKKSQELYQKVHEHAAGLPIQITCDTSVAMNMKWAKAFGFKPTPRMVLEAV